MSIWKKKPAKFRVRRVDPGPGEDVRFELDRFITHVHTEAVTTGWFLWPRFTAVKTPVQEWQIEDVFTSQATAEARIDKILNYPKQTGVIYYDEDGDKLPSAPGDILF